MTHATPDDPDAVTVTDGPPAVSAARVFLVFLRLGLTSFGGPIAHIGYFRDTFVARLGWLDDARFSQLLAICQLLPGPASSQMGFAIGLDRAGWRGAAAAFAGFTLPSALLMLALAGAAPLLAGEGGQAVLQGLKLVAVVVVATAVLAMARSQLRGVPHVFVALAATALLLATGAASTQLLAVALGALAGAALLPAVAAPAAPAARRVGVRTGWLAGAVFSALLLAALALTPERVAAGEATPTLLAAAFYRAGALVFGGGHVVLPLLDAALVAPGWLSPDAFLAGYGGAQALPGPMFALAAFLGAEVATGAPPWWGAALALAAIFLPGMLLLVAALPLWHRVAHRPRFGAALAGVNAAVVGLLAAALYDPVWRTAVTDWRHVAIVAAGFALHAGLRISALWTVLFCVLCSCALAVAAG